MYKNQPKHKKKEKKRLFVMFQRSEPLRILSVSKLSLPHLYTHCVALTTITNIIQIFCWGEGPLWTRVDILVFMLPILLFSCLWAWISSLIYYQSLPTLGQEATEPRRRLISLLSVTPVANVFTIIILLQWLSVTELVVIFIPKMLQRYKCH